MQYQHLTIEQRRSMIAQRLNALEADHFGHELNLASLRSLPETDATVPAAIAEAVQAQAAIESAVMVCRAELAALPA